MSNTQFRRNGWQQQAIQLLEKYRLLTARELIRLLELYDIRIGKSSVYNWLKNDSLVKSSSVIRQSKTRAYYIGKPIPSEEAFSIYLHNEFFVMKMGMRVPKPTTEQVLKGYVQKRIEQQKQQGHSVSPVLEIEYGSALANLFEQQKLKTSPEPVPLYRIIKSNRVGFICLKKLNTWIIYDTPTMTMDALISRLGLLGKDMIEHYYSDLSHNVLVLTLDPKRVARFLRPHSFGKTGMKISIASPY